MQTNIISLGRITTEDDVVSINVKVSDALLEELYRENGINKDMVGNATLVLAHSFASVSDYLVFTLKCGADTLMLSTGNYAVNKLSCPEELIDEVKKLVTKKYRSDNFNRIMSCMAFRDYGFSFSDAEEFFKFTEGLPYEYDADSLGLRTGDYTTGQVVSLWYFHDKLNEDQLSSISYYGTSSDTMDVVGEAYVDGMTMENLKNFMEENGIDGIDGFQETEELWENLYCFCNSFARRAQA